MIEASGLSYYYGAAAAVRDVSFRIAPGDVVAYLGANGSGKSTTVRMLAGLTAPTHGTITLDGRDIHDDLARYKGKVGYVPEEAHMYTFLSPEEYLRLAGRLRGLDDRRIDDRVDRFLRVFGLDVARHSRLSALSKGMRQKVLLSAALLHDPKVVILDEPTSGLDLTSMLALRAVVGELARDKRMIFYSSHELGAIEKIATRVVILRAGCVAASGTVDELRDLTHQTSLEDAFAELAVHDDIDAMAGQVLDAMRA